jgi:hypothetical protein
MLATDHYPYYDVATPNHENCWKSAAGKSRFTAPKQDTITLRYAFPSRFQGL